MIGGSGGPLIPGGGGGGFSRSSGGAYQPAVVTGRVFDPLVMKRLWGYLRPFKRQLWLTLLLVIITAGMQLTGPFLLKVAIDEYIVTTTDFGGLSVLAVVFGLTLLIAYISQSTQMWIMARITQRVLNQMRHELFVKINRLPLSYHDRHESGVTMSRIVNDVAVFQELLTQGAVNVIADLLILLGIMSVMLALSPKLALYTLSVLPIMALATIFFTIRARTAYLRTRETIGEVAASFQENVSGVRIVQAFARERVSRDRFDAINRGNRNANLAAVLLSSAFPPIVEFMGMLATAIVLWFGVQAVLAGEVTLGVVVAFLTYITRFFQPVRELAQVYTLFQQAMAAGEKIFELLDYPLAVADRPSARPMPPIRGTVEFLDVSFSYVPGIPVLKNVHFSVEPGQTVALVGPTGAGKTSIASLLARFYDVTEGAVLIDDTDIRDVTMESLRGQMGLVPQDPFLFSGNVRDNIAFGRMDATDEEVMTAAKLVNAHDFIMRLPQGYRTEVNERGQNYSQGQRQLLAFARAVLADPAILILDEATASVDTRTEVLIQDALRQVLQGRTSFVIAHRLSTIRNADHILVINNGEIVQRGTHRGLLNQRGMYRDLYLTHYRRDMRATGAGQTGFAAAGS